MGPTVLPRPLAGEFHPGAAAANASQGPGCPDTQTQLDISCSKGVKVFDESLILQLVCEEAIQG